MAGGSAQFGESGVPVQSDNEGPGQLSEHTPLRVVLSQRFGHVSPNHSQSALLDSRHADSALVLLVLLEGSAMHSLLIPVCCAVRCSMASSSLVTVTSSCRGISLDQKRPCATLYLVIAGCMLCRTSLKNTLQPVKHSPSSMKRLVTSCTTLGHLSSVAEV